MKAQEIIDHLHELGTWVNWAKTRDLVLYGDPQIEVNKVGVCWMLTNKALKKAITDGVNFIISHENPFYEASTHPYYRYYLSAQAKQQLMKEHNICAFRCHDVWDCLPQYGIADIWAKVIGLPFAPRVLNSFNSYASFDPLPLVEVARKVAEALAPHGQDTVQIYGNPDRLISSLVIGTGAAIDIDSMLGETGVEAVVISEDGTKSYTEIQYCLDNDIPVVRVNHASCEIPGMLSLVEFLQDNLKVEVIYLPEGFDAIAVSAES